MTEHPIGSAAAAAIVLSMLLASGAQGRTLVVNPAAAGADDANPGSDSQPLRTIARAAALAQPGDVVRIGAGVYREAVTIKQSGTQDQPIRFEAAPGVQPVVTGADPLTGWAAEGDGVFSTAWPYPIVPPNEHLPGGVEQVFVQGQLLREAASRKDLTDGAFYIDEARKRVFVRASANPDRTQADRPVEASARALIWDVSGAHVHTRGLRFRCAANRAQHGMAKFHGPHALVEDCVFEWSNSTGANFTAEDITVRRCVFQDNGQQGFSGSRAHRLRMEECTVQRNNVKEYPRGWEAGGNKICVSRGVIYENCRFLANHGSGVWFDISDQDCTVRNCLIADNEDAGIFYEISYGLHAHDNVVVANGLRPSKGSWGANGGICVSSSPGCVVERNLIVGNQQGFCFREQNRTTPRTDGKPGSVPIWNHDEVIRHNIIAGNLTGQVQGWFDIADERHWPKAMQAAKPEGAKPESGKPRDDLAAGYQAKTGGVPTGLSLEDLKIAFQGNVYACRKGQPFFIWGTNWKRKQTFQDIPSLTKALGFEDPQSRMLPALPVDLPKRDFRLPKDLLSAVAQAYPQGKVPDCLLGVR